MPVQQKSSFKRVLHQTEIVSYFKRRSEPLPHIKNDVAKPPSFNLLLLKSRTQDRIFKVYKDLEIGLDMTRFDNPLIESYQDDDVDTDDDMLRNGT